MLRIHFINVGQGDCCIIEFLDHDRVAMIDINRSTEMDEESASEILSGYGKNSMTQFYRRTDLLRESGYPVSVQDPIEYLKDIKVASIFRFISTHPHNDHISGIKKLFEAIQISNIWILKNEFEESGQEEDLDLYYRFRDCEEDEKDGTRIVRPMEGASNNYWNEDKIQILAPNKKQISKAHDEDDPNLMSYVLLIHYGNCKIVLGGDAGTDTWQYLATNYEHDLADITILKASHHGRSNGYYQPAVEIMSPEYTIVSVGKKPETDASNNYRRYSDYVYSTRWKGNIVFECYENGKFDVTTEFER